MFCLWSTAAFFSHPTLPVASWLDGPHAWLAGPQTWLDGTEGQMYTRTDKQFEISGKKSSFLRLSAVFSIVKQLSTQCEENAPNGALTSIIAKIFLKKVS